MTLMTGYNPNSSREQGKRISALRKKLDLTRSAFARRQDLSLSGLQAMEEGRYKYGINEKSSEQLIQAFYNEGLVVTHAWLTQGVGEIPKSKGTVSLYAKHHPVISNDVLETTKKNAVIMSHNRSAIKATMKNEITKLKLAIKQGANVHLLKEKELYIVTGGRQDTLLHVASEYAKGHLINYIIKELGIHPNIRNRHIDAPIHLACLNNNVEAVSQLLEFDADREASSREGATPLMWAAYMGHTESIQLLVKAHVQLDNTDHYGNTAAHWAAYNNKVAALELLHHSGAHLHIENHEKLTPLLWASKNGHLRAVEFLMRTK